MEPIVISQATGQIIILNGTPRSGKSRLAAAIQVSFPGVWMNLGVDHFMAMTPAHLKPGMGLRPGGERPDLELFLPPLYRALYGAIAAHSREGLSVVVDVGHHDSYSQPLGILPVCARLLTDLPALFVGVRCPLEVILERRLATGYDLPGAPIPPAVALWQKAVHEPGVYDLEVDTSQLTPEACATRIRKYLDSGAVPTALSRLAAQ